MIQNTIPDSLSEFFNLCNNLDLSICESLAQVLVQYFLLQILLSVTTAEDILQFSLEKLIGLGREKNLDYLTGLGLTL